MATKVENNVPMSWLSAHPKNPRKNKATIDKVAQSISLYGYRSPIVVDANNVILAGHTRFEALKLLGYKEVPFVVVSDGTDAENERFLLADNKTSEFSDWDYLELKQFDVETLQTVGFSDAEVSKILAESQIGEGESEQQTDRTRDINYGDVFLCQGANATHRVVFGEWNNALHVASLKVDVEHSLCICAPHAVKNSVIDDGKLSRTFADVYSKLANGAPVALLAPISECVGVVARFGFDGIANLFRANGYQCQCMKVVIKNDKTLALGVGVAAQGDVLAVLSKSEVNDDLSRPSWVDYPVWFNVGKKGQMPYSAELYRRIIVMMSKKDDTIVDLMCDNGAALLCSETYSRTFCGICGDKSALVSILTNFETTFGRVVVRESDGKPFGDL